MLTWSHYLQKRVAPGGRIMGLLSQWATLLLLCSQLRPNRKAKLSIPPLLSRHRQRLRNLGAPSGSEESCPGSWRSSSSSFSQLDSTSPCLVSLPACGPAGGCWATPTPALDFCLLSFRILLMIRISTTAVITTGTYRDLKAARYRQYYNIPVIISHGHAGATGCST